MFDASAKRNNSAASLNECLFRGPLLLNGFAGVLLRFRLTRFAVVADIEKAFLQIGLNDEARDLVRFFWLKDPMNLDLPNNLQIYRFTRVPFRVVSSPFLLAARLRQHLAGIASVHASEMLEKLYIDNLFLSSHSTEDARAWVQTSRIILTECSMKLRVRL